jgi:hypothetical protein
LLEGFEHKSSFMEETIGNYPRLHLDVQLQRFVRLGAVRSGCTSLASLGKEDRLTVLKYETSDYVV